MMITFLIGLLIEGIIIFSYCSSQQTVLEQKISVLEKEVKEQDRIVTEMLEKVKGEGL